MSKKVPVKWSWTAFDDDAARNWSQSASGQTNVRQGNSARILENLAHGVNHLLAYNPRPMFTQSQPIVQADTTGSDPLYTWRYDDNIENNQLLRTVVVTVPRTLATNSAANAAQWGTANNYDTEAYTGDLNATVSTVNKYYDASYDTYIVNRATFNDAVVEDGISTFGGYTVLSVTSQDIYLPVLDEDDHIYCDPTLSRKGGKVLADANEDVRSRLHSVRANNLPIVFSWSATSQTSNTAPPGDVDGITLVNTAYTNFFDYTITTRNSDTPGQTYDAQYCGRGTTDITDNTKVKVLCKVKAVADGTSGVDANVKFIGPESFAANETVIPISIGGGLGWFGNTDHFIYLDSSVAGSLGSVNANKIDCHGKVSGATDWIDLYRIRCWVEYS